MDLDPSQYSEADRRAVDPPIPVEMATWSKAGQLDWWVKERQDSAGSAVATAGSAGSKLLIFVPRAAHSDELSFHNPSQRLRSISLRICLLSAPYPTP
jgi:hypothetical protein